jgi:hypothetical protein
MPQCKKTLPNGEQCSNRAVPGTDYCEEHRQRLKFRPVSTKQDPTGPAGQKTAQRKKPAPKTPTWGARPGAAGEAPVFPGLRIDGRNILVGPQGMIRLGQDSIESRAAKRFDLLVRLLTYISRHIPLHGHVSLWNMQEERGALVGITPPDPKSVDLSRFYDLVSEAAVLCGALLYIGTERLFIQYRDGNAPRGYDAKDVKIPDEGNIYLVDKRGTHLFSPDDLSEEPLDCFLLRVPPLPDNKIVLPEVAYALVEPALYRMLARYFRAHNLRYRVARFDAKERNKLVLFEVAPMLPASTSDVIPAFVLSYLTSLPCCEVLIELASDSGRQILAAWKHSHPCQSDNILDAFPRDSLLLFTKGRDFSNLCIHPAPTFFEGDELISVRAPRQIRADLTPANGTEDLPLEIPVRFVKDDRPSPFPAALILDPVELGWVRRLIYRIPGEVFSRYMLCRGEKHSVLLGEGISMDRLPFGIPLRRVQDTSLFIPLHSRLSPALPWQLLAKALKIRDDYYTFIAEGFRIDVTQNAFVPLSHGLVAEPGRPRTAFVVRPEPYLPPLKWTPPPIPQETERKIEKKKWYQQLFRSDNSMPQKIILPIKRTRQEKKRAPVKTTALIEEKEIMRQQGESYRRTEDYLSAALCFAMAGDKANAAYCYKKAAYGIKPAKTQGKKNP